jgi:(E)-2-((N-methylformamido)methylene)succinate hydrolase
MTGSDVVLLHGVGLDHRMWARCRVGLARRHHVTALDLLGHGSAPAAPPGTTLADLADDVAARMPGTAHLVGFSLGALVATQVALSRPERVHSLGLVSSVARRSPEQAAAVRSRLEAARADFDATARTAIDRWFSPEWRATEPGLADEMLATLRGNDRTSYFACYEVFATADAELFPHLPDIQAPTLAVTGADDPGSTPDMARLLADTIPQARAEIIPNARHLLPLERPEPLTRLLLAHTAEVAHV